MEIKKCKGKENKFILDGKKVTIKKEISEEFYLLMKEKKYDEVFDLIEDKTQFDDKTISKKIIIYGSVVVLECLMLYLSSKFGVNLLGELSWVALGVSGSLIIKEVVGVFNLYFDRMKVQQMLDKETQQTNVEEFENVKSKSLKKEKINIQKNGYVFDKNKDNDSNIIDFNDFKNKRR